jgi:hypothetical protein
VDANTRARWVATEGFGTALADDSGNANHGTIANGTWCNTPNLDTDSPGARIYGWGNAIGSDAVSEGIKQTWTGLTAGGNYKLYALGYSEDGIGQPVLTIYDETNAAVIASITGTVASTEWSPDRLVIAFKLPTIALGAVADCVSISIKLLSATAGNVGWHKAELMSNLIDDPGYELNVAVTNVGTPTTSDRSNVQAHSGTWSHRIVTDAIGEGFKHSPATTVGKYYRATAWVYTAANAVTMGSGATLHNGSTAGINSAVGAAWNRVQFVFRAVAANTDISFISTTAVQTFYVDDFSVAILDDVTLTVTPASQANSLEGTGIRVDGLDRLTQPIINLKLSKGIARFPYTPRHSAATPALFGNATPVIAHLYVDANNYILLDWSLANTIRLRYNAGGAGVQTGTYNATGAIVAGTRYILEIRYTGGAMHLRIDNILVLTITAPTVFTIVPTVANWLHDNLFLQQNDAVIG